MSWTRYQQPRRYRGHWWSLWWPFCVRLRLRLASLPPPRARADSSRVHVHASEHLSRARASTIARSIPPSSFPSRRRRHRGLVLLVIALDARAPAQSPSRAVRRRHRTRRGRTVGRMDGRTSRNERTIASSNASNSNSNASVVVVARRRGMMNDDECATVEVPLRVRAGHIYRRSRTVYAHATRSTRPSLESPSVVGGWSGRGDSVSSDDP